MTEDVALRCTCGEVRGAVRLQPAGMRLQCLCRSCRAFAHFLERQDDALDAHGASDIYQVTPSQLRFEQGAEQLRCLRLSDGGPLRWYTACCSTPVANTLPQRWLPFAGLQVLMMDHDAVGKTRDELLGPVRHILHGRFADPPVPGAHPSGPPSLLLGTVVRLFGHWLRGRQRPSPFFDGRGAPLRQVRRLSQDELAAIGLGRSRRAAAS